MTRSHRVLIIVTSSSLIAVLIYIFGWSNLFTVKSVQVLGAPTAQAAAEVEKSLSIEPSQKLARLDPRALSHRLDSYRWIDDVSVKRNWISGVITISITPRIPIGIYNSEAIDLNGKLFNLPGGVDQNLPKVSAGNVESGMAAIRLFSTLPKDFQSQISRLSASRLNDYLIYCTVEGRDLRIKFGDEKNVELKIKVINSLLKLPENKEIKFIDLTAPHAPIVK